MKLLIYTQLWKRPKLTRLCFMGLDRIRRESGYQVELFAVISEEEMIPLCEEFGVHWTMCDNLPLGRKHNIGLEESLKLEWDYCLNIGSDDMISTKLFDIYNPLFEQGVDFFGVNDIYFFGNNTLYYYQYKERYTPFGAGRVTSRRMIEEIKGNGRLVFWQDDLNKGLDKSSADRSRAFGYEPEFLEIKEPLIVDVKTGTNIWGIASYAKRSNAVDPNILLDYYPTEELKYLLTINTMSVKKYQAVGETRLRKKYNIKDESGKVIEEKYIDFQPRAEGPCIYITGDPKEQEMIESRSDFGKTIIEVFREDDPAPVILIKEKDGQKTYEVQTPIVPVITQATKPTEAPVIKQAEEVEFNKEEDTAVPDLRFAEISNANQAAGEIRKAFEIEDFTVVRGKENLRKFCDENNIKLPLIFEEHK